MKRVWGHVLAGASVMGWAASVASGCVHDDSTLIIRNVLENKYSSGAGGMGCVFTADPTQTYIGSGVLDVALTSSYDAQFMVANQMVPLENPNQLRAETAYVRIEGAIVRTTDSQGNQLSNFTALTSATLNPSTGGTPGFLAVGATIVDQKTIESDPSILNLIAGTPLGSPSGVARIVTYTRLFGRSAGGQYIESNEFEFPIAVCYGCLINFTNAASIPATATTPLIPTLNLPNCAPVTMVGTSSSTVLAPCVTGQDLAADCAACQGFTACRGAYPNGLPTH